MKLKDVRIEKYKCVENTQEFVVEDDVTVLVGMNESGKTSLLEAIAKTNYFQKDEKFKFNTTHDYPRKEKKDMDKTCEVPIAIACTYSLDKDDKSQIEKALGREVFNQESVVVTTGYDNKNSWSVSPVNRERFIEFKTKETGIQSKTLTEKLLPIQSIEELDTLISEYSDEDKKAGLLKLKPFYENSNGWDCPIREYIVRKILKPALPKFLYYDEYYTLPSRISIENLQQEDLKLDELKTAKALFELADINVDEIVNTDEFENFVAELEATEAIITEELFKYWTTNTNLDIVFKIDKRIETDPQNNKRIAEHILDIRVKNTRTRVSLPLRNRSKGFNWFFSFLVWFKKVQEDQNSKYIILLDEPGLNLHASAQADLLRFINDLSDQYQIIYTTHSPFMVSSDKLERVRTIYEGKNGAEVSETIQQKDPSTLFPLQAALGYDIAQNLFINKKNLLVEGPSDLIYLTMMSSILEDSGKEALKEDIIIVPIGGLDKVASFISLLRGQKLDLVCLLDSFTDQKGKRRLDDLTKMKIIKERDILFFDQFSYLEGDIADLEDIFDKTEYLKFFNAAFHEHDDIATVPDQKKPILKQINLIINKSGFNHYRPANFANSQGLKEKDFSDETLERFEIIFKEVNSRFA